MATGQVTLPAGFVLDTPSSASAPTPITAPTGFVLDDGVNMQGQDGKTVRVPPSQVADMRKGNYAVQPDNPGAQKMLTKNGQITYALPSEAPQWEKDKTAVRVNEDGSLLVPPGQSEWSQEYRERHDLWFQAHQHPAVRNALNTSDRTENAAGNFMLGSGIAGNAIVAAPAAADAGLNYLGRGALPGMERVVARQALAKIAPNLVKTGAGGAIGGATILGAKWLAKMAKEVAIDIAGDAGFEAIGGK
jgi:hypothetical protein